MFNGRKKGNKNKTTNKLEKLVVKNKLFIQCFMETDM